MSEMVDRVAKALMCSLHGHDDFSNAHPAMQAAYLRQARAVIAAMREPTDQMLDVAYDRDDWDDACSHAEAWRVMIDAALSLEAK